MNEFFGTPVLGEVRPGSPYPVQYGARELKRQLDALLAFDEVQSVRWAQFTPYFNDGEPCVFGVTMHGIDVGLRGMDSQQAYPYGDYEDDHIDAWDVARREEFLMLRHLKPALKQLSDDLSSGHYDETVRVAFGDHAVVTVYADRIEVDEAYHD